MERLALERHLDGGPLGEDEAGSRRDVRVPPDGLVAGHAGGERVARRERLVDGFVVGVPVVDAEGRERLDERALRVA